MEKNRRRIGGVRAGKIEEGETEFPFVGRMEIESLREGADASATRASNADGVGCSTLAGICVPDGVEELAGASDSSLCYVDDGARDSVSRGLLMVGSDGLIT